MKTKESIRELVDYLNRCCDAYYNEAKPLISDQEYDLLFEKLRLLEKESGLVYSDSPTRRVGYEIKSKLQKVKHNHPMLSLSKTKSLKELAAFLNAHIGFLMLKMDGLTVSLRYLNGKLVSAETRGNGEVGEDILHNAMVFSNIPLAIPFQNELIVDGEAIIDYATFNKINQSLSEEEQYKNPRNLVSGSVRQLDSKIAAGRNIKFLAWKMVKGINSNSFIERLKTLRDLGFEVVDYDIAYPVEEALPGMIEGLKKAANTLGYPIDGLVASYDDISLGDSLGATNHHVRSQLAYKFEDDVYETNIRAVEWTMGKTGVLTPTAVFDPVEIDGTEVERASVHNVSIFDGLNLHHGDTVTVYKANMIIPQIAENLDRDSTARLPFDLPEHCPYCDSKTEIRQDGAAKTLVCTNAYCSGKKLGQFVHFVSKNAMNIDGLSEAILSFLLERNWIHSFIDLYMLKEDPKIISDWENATGFGSRSVEKILQSIENSRRTTLDRFLYALCIPNLGRSAAKVISKVFSGDFQLFYDNCCIKAYRFSDLDGFGEQAESSIQSYLTSYRQDILSLSKELIFETEKKETEESKIAGKTFVITGSLETYPNRDALVALIEQLGGKVSGSVSKKTDYLINNDMLSTSGKNKKAKELNVPILSEKDFNVMIGGNAYG